MATVALNTDPVPQLKELTVAQKYAILAEQGSNCQQIKVWVKKNFSFMYGNFETNDSEFMYLLFSLFEFQRNWEYISPHKY